MHREIHDIAGTIFNFGVFSLNQTTFNFKKKSPLLFDSTLKSSILLKIKKEGKKALIPRWFKSENVQLMQ